MELTEVKHMFSNHKRVEEQLLDAGPLQVDMCSYLQRMKVSFTGTSCEDRVNTSVGEVSTQFTKVLSTNLIITLKTGVLNIYSSD